MPEHFNNPELLCLRKLLVKAPRELLELDRVIGRAASLLYQQLRFVLVEGEKLLQPGKDRVILSEVVHIVGPRYFNQQQGRRYA